MTKKTFYTLLSILLFAGLSHAQPIIQNNVIPDIGKKVFQATSDTNAVQVGNPGANQTWNFSALAPLSPATMYEYITPVGTPYAANFPTSNLALRWNDGSGSGYSYGYERKEANQLLILGVRSANYVLDYVDPDAQLKYPTNYNGTYQDNYSYTTDAGTGFPFLSIGSHSVKYDAYGTLITPFGTFQNAMRIKASTIQTDSANFFGNEIINHHNNVTYDWFVANQPGALVSVTYFHTITETRYPGIDTLFSESGPTKTVNYVSASTVGVFDAPRPLTGLAAFSVAPNPAVDRLSLRFSADLYAELQVEIIDLQGKIVQTQSMTANIGDNLVDLSVVDLPIGAYFLTLSDGRSLQSWPWQKM